MYFFPELTVNAPGIVYNGSVIYDFNKREVLWKISLDEEVVEIIKKLAEKFPELGIEVLMNDIHYFLRENEVTDWHKNFEDFVPAVVPIESIDLIPKEWCCIVLAWKPDRLIEVELYLKELFKENNNDKIRMVYSQKQFLELMNINASKGNALNNLIELLGIQDLNIIAVGDNLNDLEMIKYADTGIAVGNAHPKLKAIANYTSVHHNDHVIRDVLDWIKSNNMNKE